MGFCLAPRRNQLLKRFMSAPRVGMPFFKLSLLRHLRLGRSECDKALRNFLRILSRSMARHPCGRRRRELSRQTAVSQEAFD